MKGKTLRGSSATGHWPARAAMICLVIACCMAGGCATQRRLAEEAVSARTAAAGAWTAARDEDDKVFVEGLLRLEDAIKLALEHNKDLRAAYLEQDVGRGRVLESYGQALPRLTANAGYTRLDEVGRLDVGGREISLGFEDNYSADLTVRQPLFHGGAIPAALRAAKLYALLSEQTTRAAVQGVIFQTAKEYYDLLLAREMVTVREQALKLAEALAADVQRKRRSGMASDYDVLRAEVEVSNTRAELIKLRNMQELAGKTLLKTMGVSLRGRVTPADELEYRPATTALDEAMREAQRKRPELLQAEYAVRMQREAVRAARSAYAPRVDAFFTQKWARPDPHSSLADEWGDAWTAGITAALPIFDGFERRGRLVQEQARLEQAQTRLLAQEEAVALDVEQAVMNLRNAEELVESQKMNLQRAEEGLRLVQAGYVQGVRSELEVLDAQTALTRARALYYEALHAHMTARLYLRGATGALAPVLPSAEPAANAENVLDAGKEDADE